MSSHPSIEFIIKCIGHREPVHFKAAKLNTRLLETTYFGDYSIIKRHIHINLAVEYKMLINAHPHCNICKLASTNISFAWQPFIPF